MKKRLWALASAEQTIGEALVIASALTEMKSEKSDKVFDPLMSSITTLYSRPFTNNNGVGRIPKLESKLSESAHQTHNFLLQQRNMIGAHSDATVRNSVDGTLTRDLKLHARWKKDGEFIIDHELPVIRIPSDHIKSIHIMITEMYQLVKQSIDDTIGLLFWDEENSCPAAELDDMQPGSSKTIALNFTKF